MLITEKAAAIRRTLKTAHGWTSRQVSVRTSASGGAIEIRIKDPVVQKPLVEALASPHEKVIRDEGGNICRGGNTFVFVQYDRDAPAIRKVTELVEGALSDEPGRVVDLPRGWKACRENDRTRPASQEYRYWHGEDRDHMAVDKAAAACALTSWILSTCDADEAFAADTAISELKAVAVAETPAELEAVAETVAEAPAELEAEGNVELAQQHLQAVAEGGLSPSQKIRGLADAAAAIQREIGRLAGAE